MAKRLLGTIFSILFQLHPTLHKTSLAPARALSTVQKMPEPCDLFEYTTGQWIYNDALRHRERRRAFNISELKRLAAVAVQQKEDDVAGFEKLAEGGFNRSFKITMRDGFQFVARIPYPVTEPKFLVVASEVATIDFLRSHGIPVPKIFGYSAVADNSAGTEYIFMELVQGQNLGDIWFTLSEQERITLVTKLVQLESRLFGLRFPASGSLYYYDDLPAHDYPVIVPSPNSTCRFCIGPDTSLGLWYEKRLNLSVERGPSSSQRDVQPQSHLEHIVNLEKYLQIARHLIPQDSPALHRPVIRHPDLQPNNIFHSTVLPLFLQCGIPQSLQNYGDEISESLQTPSLPRNFDKLEEMQQFQQAEPFRKRQLHYLYVRLTAEKNPEHYNALTYHFSTLRRRIFHHASDPWEGDNITLKADLVTLSKNWGEVTGDAGSPCPIFFSDDESSDCLRLAREQSDADQQFQACQEAIGVANEGWVPVAYYDEAKARERKLKADALDTAETEEKRARIEKKLDFR
ncbi:kinase-like domain-containing protein [Aspergillus minisclerotigenes]|uniref:Kinase-like domain-containing protein n=1 Tax=Aspergillus minisclerotigenes TaxID=656917 RepID=A0A5N6JHT4_9EURO|nr:kinase-like domain-containing protein [Aspergillus minisclerotigenes]